MVMRSRFISDYGKLSKPRCRFERWLRDQGYEAASEMYPAAVQALSLVDDYLREYPEHALMQIIVEHHAKLIGWVSDYQDDEPDEEGPEEPEES